VPKNDDDKERQQDDADGEEKKRDHPEQNRLLEPLGFLLELRRGELEPRLQQRGEIRQHIAQRLEKTRLARRIAVADLTRHRRQRQSRRIKRPKIRPTPAAMPTALQGFF